MASPRHTQEITERTRSRRGMHVCPRCSSEMVQPLHWFEQSGRRWHVELRCPECEWLGRGSFAQHEVDRFDRELDRGARELIEDLRSVTRANMEQEIQGFTRALMTDGILPEDF